MVLRIILSWLNQGNVNELLHLSTLGTTWRQCNKQILERSCVVLKLSTLIGQ